MSKSKYSYPCIQAYYTSGHTREECCAEFGISPSGFDRAVRLGNIITRSMSESQKLSNNLKPRTHTAETKAKLREHMLRRLAEGTYPTLGRSNRRIGQPSYPEKFFAKVVENDFDDKQVTKEMPFGIYSLDFAWPHLKKCIEIDGNQHFETAAAIERDARKDSYIQSQGWEVLRIRWTDMFHNPARYIQQAKEFIDLHCPLA